MVKKAKEKRNDPRINMTFYDDHLKFCRFVAYKNHQSITQYVNNLIAQDMAKYDRDEWDCSEQEETT